MAPEKGKAINYDSLTRSDMKKAVQRMVELESTAKGGFGEVHSLHVKGKKVAVKKIEKNNQEALSHFQTEKMALTTIGCHKNIVKFLGSYEEDDQYNYLFLEYYNESLQKKSKDEGFSIVDFIKVGMALAEGLQHIHRSGFIHCDIKPDNLMFGQDDEVKIIDFGAATSNKTEVVTSTKAYMPKEKEATEKFDVYAYGLTMIQLLSLEDKPKIKKKKGSSLINKIFYQSNKSDQRRADSLEQLLQRCIRADFNDRPTIAEILTVLSDI